MTIKTNKEYKQAKIALLKAIEENDTTQALELLEAIANYGKSLLQVF